MARITFRYIGRNSPLHRWDSRPKLFGLLMVTLSLLSTRLPLLLLLSGLLFGLLVVFRFPWKTFIRDLRTWLLFLLVLSLLQTFSTSWTSEASLPSISVSRDGLLAGALTFWRLGLILGFGVLFTAVTRPRELQDALVWLLRPFPFLPAQRIGLMTALTFRLFTLLLDEAEEVRLAHRARLGDRCRNPWRKLKSLALPVLRRSFSRAEEVTFALAARGYCEDKPLGLSPLLISHLWPLPILGGLLLAGAFLG